jgi:hypothetical protein
LPATPRIPCEFFLIRYVPDVVKGEFVNIGVLLREVGTEPGRAAASRLLFTRNWSRVRGLYPDANIAMLESLEAEILVRLKDEALQPVEVLYPRRILATLLDSCSNSIQISVPQACLVENLQVTLDQLMRLHVESLKERQVTRERTGRSAIVAAMRTAFEKTGAWSQMQKRIPAAQYTRPGDPMKLDCGYSIEVPDRERQAATDREDAIRIFHAVSLERDVESAKGLAFSAPQLREGAVRLHKKRCVDTGRNPTGLEFDLAAVVEPLRSLSAESGEETNADDFGDEVAELYLFGVFTMESAGIRVLTMNNLVAAAERARSELRL